MEMYSGEYDTIDYDSPEKVLPQRYICVTQSFIRYSSNFEEKMDHTIALLSEYSEKKTKALILVNRIQDVNMIEYALMTKGDFKADKTHGKITQDERELSIWIFKQGRARVFVSTIRLCGRGVNISDLTNLIIWKIPDTLPE